MRLTYLYQGSEFGHWMVQGDKGAFALRHPSLGQAPMRELLSSEVHSHKVHPIGTGRLIALVGTSQEPGSLLTSLHMLFGLVLFIHPRQSSKDERPAARILRQCNPKQVEIAFLTAPATQFFAGEQVQILRDHMEGLVARLNWLKRRWTTTGTPGRTKFT